MGKLCNKAGADTNKKPTFAEKLKKHTELLGQTEEKAKAIIAQAKIAMISGNEKEADKLMAEAEMCLEITDKTLQEFETNHSSEFSKLKSICNYSE